MSALSSLDVGAIGPDCAGVLMSPEEFDAITGWDNLYNYELIHGVLVVTPIPSEEEADPNDMLGHWLRSWAEEHPQGSALDATMPERYIHLPDSRRRPDRVVWAGLGRRPNPREDVPTIAVEFVSKGNANWRRDYQTKRREYLALGVVEYWVIDRFARTLTVFRNPPGPAETVVKETEVYRTPLLPGFELPLSRLLAAAAAWQ